MMLSITAFVIVDKDPGGYCNIMSPIMETSHNQCKHFRCETLKEYHNKREILNQSRVNVAPPSTTLA